MNARTVNQFFKQIFIAGIVTIVILVVKSVGNALYPHLDFMPHGMCYIWYKPMLVSVVIADLLIFAAYLIIPVSLFYFIKKQRQFPMTGLFFGVILFIFFCGLTHLMDVITVWHPVYWIALGIKIVTAATSLPTALYLAHTVPQFLATIRLKELLKDEIDGQQPEQLTHAEAVDKLQRLSLLLKTEPEE